MIKIIQKKNHNPRKSYEIQERFTQSKEILRNPRKIYTIQGNLTKSKKDLTQSNEILQNPRKIYVIQRNLTKSKKDLRNPRKSCKIRERSSKSKKSINSSCSSFFWNFITLNHYNLLHIWNLQPIVDQSLGFLPFLSVCKWSLSWLIQILVFFQAKTQRFDFLFRSWIDQDKVQSNLAFWW